MTTATDVLSRPALSIEELTALAETLEAAVRRKTYRYIDFAKIALDPYPKQAQFFAFGATKRERMLTSGNQQGKTESGAYEIALHLTGEYPPWWAGRRWDRAVKVWICGKSSLDVRNTQQKKLCGEPGVESAFGTGFIPKEAFVDKPSLSRGVTDAYDTIQVRHKSGGISIARFKSYEQGREAFQADSIDIIWDDEEPPYDVYTEQLARLTATQGMIFVTYTSMKGMSTLTGRFRQEVSPDRAIVQMGLRDAKHIPESEYQKIIEGYPEWERAARVHGGVMQGEGRVFTYPEEALREPAIERLPMHWRKLWGIDPGVGHPFGAALIAWDLDSDIIHVVHAFRMRGEGQTITPLNHAAAMKPIGAAVPVAWPKDAGDRAPDAGEPLTDIYRGHGLNMLYEHATWPDGSVSTEAGITEMDERMKTGRLKVAEHLEEWFEEYRGLHRKDMKIVKIADDILSATRVAIMMKRFARAVELGGHASRLMKPMQVYRGRKTMRRVTA